MQSTQTSSASETNSNPLLSRARKHVESTKRETMRKLDSKDPNSFPPEKFDRYTEADRMAYLLVNPNWPYGGQWFSKQRYGKCFAGGQMFPWHIQESRAVKQPGAEKNTFDQVDWEKLMPDYLYWRMRFQKQGWNIRHELVDVLG